MRPSIQTLLTNIDSITSRCKDRTREGGGNRALNKRQQIKDNWDRNTNWQEVNKLVIYKRGRGVELSSTVKQLQALVRTGLEPGTSGALTTRPCSLSREEV